MSEIERGQLEETCGLQDSIFAVFGGFNLVEFTNAGFLVHQSIASRTYLRTLASHCFLVYLGNDRLSSAQQQGLLRDMPQSSTVLNELAQMARETFGEINREVLEPRNLGARVSEGWELKKRSSPNATTEGVNALHEELERLGAWGGKILGAGGGGFYLAVADSAVRRRFEELHPDTVTCDFEWEFNGLTVRRV